MSGCWLRSRVMLSLRQNEMSPVQSAAMFSVRHQRRTTRMRAAFRLRRVVALLVSAMLMMTASTSSAQTFERPVATEATATQSQFAVSPGAGDTGNFLFSAQPAGAPPTPRHTGIKTMTRHLVTNFKYLPSVENLLWAGVGGGLALAVH